MRSRARDSIGPLCLTTGLILLTAINATARLPIESLQRDIQIRHVHTTQAIESDGRQIFITDAPRNDAHRIVWAASRCATIPPAYPDDGFYGTPFLPEEETFLVQDTLTKLDDSRLWTFYVEFDDTDAILPVKRPGFLDTLCTTNNYLVQFSAATSFVAGLSMVYSKPSAVLSGGPWAGVAYELPINETNRQGAHASTFTDRLDRAYIDSTWLGGFLSDSYYAYPRLTGYLWDYREWLSGDDWATYVEYYTTNQVSTDSGKKQFSQLIFRQGIAFRQPDFDSVSIRSASAEIFVQIDPLGGSLCRPHGFDLSDMGVVLYLTTIVRGATSNPIETPIEEAPAIPDPIEAATNWVQGWSLNATQSYSIATIDYRPIADAAAGCAGCRGASGEVHGELGSMHTRISVGLDGQGRPVGALELAAPRPEQGIAALSRLRFHGVSDSANATYTNGKLSAVTAPECLVLFTELPDPNADYGFVARYYLRKNAASPFPVDSERQLVVVQGIDDAELAEAWAAGDFSESGERQDDSVHIYEICHGSLAKHTQFIIPYLVRPATTDLATFGQLRSGRKAREGADSFDSLDDSISWLMSIANDHGSVQRSYTREVDGDTFTIWRSKEDDSFWTAEITTETYTNEAWGWALTRTVSSPWDAPEWTEFSYYTNSAENGYGKIRRVVNSDGSWQRFVYDGEGNLILSVAPFGDTSPDADESRCRVHSVTTTVDAGKTTVCEVESVKGVEVRRSYTIRTPSETLKIQCGSPGAGPTTPGNLLTRTTYEQSTDDDSPLTGRRPTRIEHADGTLTLMSYPDSHTDIEWRGAPDGGLASVVDGTRSEVHRDDFGQVDRREIFDIASGVKLSSETVTEVDAAGRPIAWRFLDGTTRRVALGCCCGTESETSREGATRFYTYDAEGRVLSTSYEGANGTAIVERAFYDAAGRLVLRGYSDAQGIFLKPTDPTFSQHFTMIDRVGFDAAGRLRWTDNAMGGRTIHDPPETSGAHQINRTTLPDGATIEEEFFTDGQLYRRSGTAEPHVEMAYGVENGEVFSQEMVPASTGDSTDWSKTYSDFLGRPYRTTYSDGSFEQTWFNEKGQEVRSVDRDGLVTLYGYNARGEREITALDQDGNGAIDYAGRDRITRVRDTVTAARGTNVRRSITEVWEAAGADAPRATLIRDVSVDGLQGWTVVDGVESHSETAYSFAEGTRTETRTNPDHSTHVLTTTRGQKIAERWMDAEGHVLRTIDFAYGAYGDLVRRDDSQAGISEFAYAVPHVLSATSRRSRDESGEALATSFGYDSSMRVVATTNADQSVTFREYAANGQLRRHYGAGVYPVEYDFDAQGRISAMRTWRNLAASGGVASTTWIYDPTNGYLARKEYGDGKGVTYTYTPGGRVKTRTWARGARTEYSYGSSGELTNIHYVGTGTPDVTLAYDRLGRTTTAAAGPATHAYGYSNNLVVSEAIAVGGRNFTIARDYDALNRDSGFKLDGNQSATYGYDRANRLVTVGSPGMTNFYVYGANGLVTASGVSGRLSVVRSHDGFDRLTGITNVTSDGPASAFSYSHDAAGRRTSKDVALGGEAPSSWRYEYDGMGQLTSAWMTAGGAEVPGRRYGYAYDDIGNRLRMTRGDGDDAVVSEFTANLLNQYTGRTVPAVAEISGTARPDAVLSFENVSTGGRFQARRNGSWFHVDMPMEDNRAASVTNLIRVTAVLPGQGPDGADVIHTNTTLTLEVTKTPEVFEYDEDGNLLSDGRFTYAWDGENRLIAISNGELAILNAYDHQGRRIGKTVAGASTNWFVYDGWNLATAIREDQNGAATNFYTWGLDISGTLQGAGGVGGLLSIGSTGSLHLACMDGSGNVITLLDARDGSVDSTYEYGPFGEMLRATGPEALTNPWRFSTRYVDPEAELVMYPARPYSPTQGRFLSRDPIEEGGGLNLYAIVGNDPVDFIDPWGWALYAFDGTWNNRAKMKRPTNVAKLFDVYKGRKWYMKGVGTTWYTRHIGGATGAGGENRIEAMYAKLTESYNSPDPTGEDLKIDVIGFSRGAALARTFVNHINRRGGVPLIGPNGGSTGVACPVKIRFMGIFDTVASFGWPGNNVNWGQNFAIPPNVENVRHAVALDEKRSMFPLSSVLSDPGNPSADPRIVEQGFRGAHSDIGGGYEDGDRSNFALMWMHDEGVSVGVPFGPLAPEDIGASNPVIHDERGWRERRRDRPRETYYPNTGR